MLKVNSLKTKKKVIYKEVRSFSSNAEKKSKRKKKRKTSSSKKKKGCREKISTQTKKEGSHERR